MDNQIDYDPLGFTVVGPPPIGVVHIAWDRVLTVLYGSNGAGKSVLLRALAACVEGRRLPGGKATRGRMACACWMSRPKGETLTMQL